MPEANTSRKTDWTDEPGTYEQCKKCRKRDFASYGVMMRRRIFERDGSMYSEYKIMCKTCKNQTGAHRSKMITEKEWEGKNRPGDGLKYRTRGPQIEARTSNIALNREAENSKGDGRNGIGILEEKGQA